MSVMRRRACLNRWCLATLLAACCLAAQAASNRSGSLVGQKAPEFLLHGIYSEDYSLEAFKGHILVMQFGTSW
jgi:hypothetical protein